MELTKELSAWSFILHQAVLSAGKEAETPLHHSAEPAVLREEGWHATASEGLGEFSARAMARTQSAKSSHLKRKRQKREMQGSHEAGRYPGGSGLCNSEWAGEGNSLSS